jgi:uncharacterized protein YjbI with pentapeptide repeats
MSDLDIIRQIEDQIKVPLKKMRREELTKNTHSHLRAYCISITMIILFLGFTNALICQDTWRSFDLETGEYITRTKQEFDSLYASHLEWLTEFALDTTENINLDTLTAMDDVRRIRLIKADLFQLNLRNYNLRFAIFDSSKMKAVWLTKTDLSYANLPGVDFTKSALDRTIFKGANLQGAIFNSSHQWIELNFESADLSNINVKGLDFTGCNIRDAVFKNILLSDLEKSIGDLEEIDIDFDYNYWERYDKAENKHFLSSSEDLSARIKSHQIWLNQLDSLMNCVSIDTTHPIWESELRLDMTLSRLNYVDLSSIDCRYSIWNKCEMRRVKFNDIKFWNSEFDSTNFTKSKIIKCNFTGSNFRKAILSGAVLAKSVFDSVDFWYAIFPSNLISLSFKGARLNSGDLVNSNLMYADLEGAYYEYVDYKNEQLLNYPHPSPKNIASARNLDYLKYENDSSILISLMKHLKNNGFSSAARKVQTAFYREDIRHGGKSISIYKRFFGIFCGYGSDPLLPIIILLISIGVFTIIYLIIIYKKNHSFEILTEVYPGQNQYKIEMEGIRYKNRRPSEIYNNFWYFLLVSILFSIMSTGNFRFREIELGVWIRKFWIKDYKIKSKGMPRIISGIQSVFSIILLTAVFLCLFSNFFDI